MNIAHLEVLAGGVIVLFGLLEAYSKLRLDGILGIEGASFSEEQRRRINRFAGYMFALWGYGVALAGALSAGQETDQSLAPDFIATGLIIGGLTITLATLLVFITLKGKQPGKPVEKPLKAQSDSNLKSPGATAVVEPQMETKAAGPYLPRQDPTYIDRAMLKLIRHQTTKAFLGPDGNWTADIRKAQPWLHAETEILHRKIKEAEIYYCFGEHTATCYDFAIRIGPSTPAAGTK